MRTRRDGGHDALELPAQSLPLAGEMLRCISRKLSFARQRKSSLPLQPEMLVLVLVCPVVEVTAVIVVVVLVDAGPMRIVGADMTWL